MNIFLFVEICKVLGVLGYEELVRKIVLCEIEGLCDEVIIDNMGNVYVICCGKLDKCVMIGVYMDEIGFMVMYIDDKGFICFIILGGFDLKMFIV